MSEQEPYQLAVDLSERYDIPLEFLQGDTVRAVQENFDFIELPIDRIIDCNE